MRRVQPPPSRRADNRENIIRRYAPFVLGTVIGRTPPNLFGLTGAEQRYVGAMARAMPQLSGLDPSPDRWSREGWQDAINEAALTVADHYDSDTQAGQTGTWSEVLEEAYGRAAQEQSTQRNPAPLGSSSPNIVIPDPPLSATPPAVAAAAAAPTPDNLISDVKANTPQAFELQKRRLSLLLANQAAKLAVPATEDEQKIITELRKRASITEKDLEACAAGLVQYNLTYVSGTYYEEDYLKRIREQEANDTAWEKLRKSWEEGAKAKYNGSAYVAKDSWTEGIRTALGMLPIGAVAGFARIFLDILKARRQGNRTWLNAATLGAAILVVAVPMLMITSAFISIPLVGGWATILTGAAVKLILLTKIAVLIAAVSNPVGAAILGGVLALIILTFLAVLVYRALLALGGKNKQQELASWTTMDPAVRKLYERDGYNLDQVDKAIHDLAARKQVLEGMKGSPEVTKELAKVDRQLEALRGHPTGTMAALGMSFFSKEADRFAQAKAALTEYAKEHATTLGVSEEACFRSAEHRLQEQRDDTTPGYSFARSQSPSPAPTGQASPPRPGATPAAVPAFDPNDFLARGGSAQGGPSVAGSQPRRRN